MDLKSDISHSTFQRRSNARGTRWRTLGEADVAWWGSCRPATPPCTPGRGAILPPSTGSSTASYYQKLGRTLEEGCFDMMFFDDRLAMPGIYGGSVAEAVRIGARPVKLDLSIVLGHRGRRHPPHRSRRHLLDDLLLAVPRGPHLRHARPPLRRSGRLERRHVGERQRGPELRRRRAPRPRRALRPRRRVPRGHHRAVGQLGRRRARARPGQPATSPTPTRSTSSTSRASGSSVRGPAHRAPLARRADPVLLQAGSSGRGRDFAARWAELIFTGDPDIDVARAHYKDQKERIGERRARPRLGEDAADGLHGGRRVDGPRPGARADVPRTTSSTRWRRSRCCPS